MITSGFFEQPLATLHQQLREWDLGSVLQATRTVIVVGRGLSPL